MPGWRALLQRIGAVPPDLVTRISALAPGRVLVEGELATDEPLPGPVSGRPCAAFQYRASCRVSTPKGFRRLSLRDVRVYAPGLRLVVVDGEVELRAPDSAGFSPGQHAALREKQYDDFRARERLVQTGHRVRVLGRARARAGTWRIDVIELLEAEESTGE